MAKKQKNVAARDVGVKSEEQQVPDLRAWFYDGSDWSQGGRGGVAKRVLQESSKGGKNGSLTGESKYSQQHAWWYLNNNKRSSCTKAGRGKP